MRVVTFNVHNGLTRKGEPNFHAVVTQIAIAAAEAVVLQEIPSRAWLGAVANAVNMVPVAFDGTPAITLGMLTRRAPTGVTYTEFDVVGCSSSRQPRGALAATLNHPAFSTSVTVVGTHLGADVTLMEQTRATWLLHKFAQRVARRGAIVIAGDLNAPAWSLPVQRLRRWGWQDAWRVAGDAWCGGRAGGCTFPVGWAFQRIDYILYCEKLVATSARVITSSPVASDHHPVMADLEEAMQARRVG